MRTTIDLPAEVHARAKRLAEEQGQSLSATVSQLAVRGLASMGDSTTLSTDPITGLPTLTLGRHLTSAQVAEALDEP